MTLIYFVLYNVIIANIGSRQGLACTGKQSQSKALYTEITWRPGAKTIRGVLKLSISARNAFLMSCGSWNLRGRTQNTLREGLKTCMGLKILLFFKTRSRARSLLYSSTKGTLHFLGMDWMVGWFNKRSWVKNNVGSRLSTSLKFCEHQVVLLRALPVGWSNLNLFLKYTLNRFAGAHFWIAGSN